MAIHKDKAMKQRIVLKAQDIGVSFFRPYPHRDGLHEVTGLPYALISNKTMETAVRRLSPSLSV